MTGWVRRHSAWLAAFVALAASQARADDPACDYDVTVLDSRAAKLEIAVACDPALAVKTFNALGNRDHWWTDPEGYSGGRGRFMFELGAFAAAEDDMSAAMPFGDGVLVTPAFLLPLPETERAVMLRFRLAFVDGGGVLTALHPDRNGRYAVPLLRINEVGPLILGSTKGTPLPGDPELTLALA